MANGSIAVYRLPTNPAHRIGQARWVTDRNKRVYIDESRVETADPSGDFTILTLATGRSLFVKTEDYVKLIR